MEKDARPHEYQERIHKLFDQINNIRNYSEEEKTKKYKEFESLITTINENLERKKEARKIKLEIFSDKISQLRACLEDESNYRTKIESKLKSDLLKFERLSAESIEEAKLNRKEIDKRLINKLNNAIDLIQAVIPKTLNEKSGEYQKDIEKIINIEIPDLQNELNNECILRKELEANIYEHFMEQIKELSELYNHEKKIRALKEEEISKVINNISQDLNASLKKQRTDREKSEENILELVEHVIERLKREVLA